MTALKRRLEVRCEFEVLLVDLFVARLTDISADIFGRALLRRGTFLVGSPRKIRLDCEQKHEQEKNGGCGRGKDLASEFHKLHTSNCQSLEVGFESENWQKWQCEKMRLSSSYLARRSFHGLSTV